MNETTSTEMDLDEGNAEHSIFEAYDIQKRKTLYFKSADNLQEWRLKRITGLIISLVVGVLLVIFGIKDLGSEFLAFILLPYMIRHFYRNGFSPKTGIGDFIRFFLVLMGAITFVYPIKKIIEELIEYNHIKEFVNSYYESQKIFSGDSQVNDSKNTQYDSVNPSPLYGLSLEELHKTELAEQIKNTFEDASHLHTGGRFTVGLHMDDDGKRHVGFVMLFEDKIHIFDLAISSLLSHLADNPEGDIDDTIHKSHIMMFGGVYIPKSRMFRIPNFSMYEEGTYEPFEHGKGKPGGFYVSDSIMISPGSLMEVDNSSPFDDNKTVSNSVVFEEIRRTAYAYPNIQLTKTYEDCIEFKVIENYGDEDNSESQKTHISSPLSSENQTNSQISIPHSQTKQNEFYSIDSLPVDESKDHVKPQKHEYISQANGGEENGSIQERLLEERKRKKKWFRILFFGLSSIIIATGGYLVIESITSHPLPSPTIIPTIVPTPIQTYAPTPIPSLIPDSSNMQPQESLYWPSPTPDSSYKNNYIIQEHLISGKKSNRNLAELQQVFFSRAAATSQIYASALDYYADKAIDGAIKTSWQENVEGQGIGEALTLYFDRDTAISYIGIFAGSFESEEAYYANSRLKRAKIDFSQGESFEYDFDDVPTITLIELSQTVSTRFVRITIEDVFPGYEWDDTAIAEVSAFR